MATKNTKSQEKTTEQARKGGRSGDGLCPSFCSLLCFLWPFSSAGPARGGVSPSHTPGCDLPAGPRDHQGAARGGTRELLRLAWPLILSNSFWTLQIILDRILLSRSGSEAVGAGMSAALLFWTPFSLLQNTAGYATTFVAQYTGAGRPHRVGPVVWQALHFSLLAGGAFLALLPLADPLAALGGHSPRLQGLEATYLRCLCFAALPMLVTAAVSAFFAGRGDSRTVLVINGVGLVVNGLLAYAWIFGRWGFPRWGIAGAGWATVLGSGTSAVVALALMLHPRHRAAYATGSGWRFDRDLFRRLLRYGLPNGVFVALDALAFTVFVLLVGRLGEVELAATGITFTLNLIAVLPMVGIGQAVEVLVGQRLGEDRPDDAERTTWAACRLALWFTGAVALAYTVAPDPLARPFRSTADPARWEEVRALVPVLLRFVACYCLFDSLNLVFSFALRGAGDTRFVTRVALALAWPVMVLPTWAAWHYHWGLYPAWAFASLYIVLLALTFLLRFRQGRWRRMRVIEPSPGLPVDGRGGEK
jgi:MATE family multidrug resistance protein